jgi:rubrerythrin
MSGDRINIDDVLSVAVKMEQEGERFYRAAARNIAHPAVHRLLVSLAKAEVKHRRQFVKMQDVIRERTDINIGRRLEMAPSVAGYLADDGGSPVFEGLDPAEFARRKTMAQVLDAAIALENEAVDFFSQLRAEMGSLMEMAVLDKIIEQERKHASSLRKIRGMVET